MCHLNASVLKVSLLVALIAMLSTAAHAVEPVIVAEGSGTAPSGHWPLAWSPDGLRLAYAGERLTIYNTIGGGSTEAPVERPLFISWLTDGRIAALFREGNNTMLGLLAPDTGVLIRSVMPKGTVSIHETPLGIEKGLLVASTHREITSEGVNILHSLHMLMPDGSIAERFRTSHQYGRENIGHLGLQGWVNTGPGPLDSRMALLELRFPRKRHSYMKLSLVDPASGQKEEVYRALSESLSPEGGWSPGGRRIALATSDGRLRILSLDGTLRAVQESLMGIAPAWSPVGSQIFFSGVIVNADGSGGRTILPGLSGLPGMPGSKSMESIQSARGFWRPDGTGLAVVDTLGAVYLFEGITTPFALPEDNPPTALTLSKLRLLADLLGEGLITDSDYSNRLERLRAGKGK